MKLVGANEIVTGNRWADSLPKYKEENKYFLVLFVAETLDDAVSYGHLVPGKILVIYKSSVGKWKREESKEH